MRRGAGGVFLNPPPPPPLSPGPPPPLSPSPVGGPLQVALSPPGAGGGPVGERPGGAAVWPAETRVTALGVEVSNVAGRVAVAVAGVRASAPADSATPRRVSRWANSLRAAASRLD